MDLSSVRGYRPWVPNAPQTLGRLLIASERGRGHRHGRTGGRSGPQRCCAVGSPRPRPEASTLRLVGEGHHAEAADARYRVGAKGVVSLRRREPRRRPSRTLVELWIELIAVLAATADVSSVMRPPSGVQFAATDSPAASLLDEAERAWQGGRRGPALSAALGIVRHFERMELDMRPLDDTQRSFLLRARRLAKGWQQRRIAVVSDIHGQRKALENILDAAARAGASEWWCLGDFAFAGEADATAELVLRRGAFSVKLQGNHDDPRTMTKAHRMSVQDYVDELGQLRPWDHLPDYGVAMFHGSKLNHSEGNARPKDKAHFEATLLGSCERTVLVGHVHEPLFACAFTRGIPSQAQAFGDLRTYEISQEGVSVGYRTPEMDRTYTLTEGGRFLLNPGPAQDGYWLELDVGPRRAVTWHRLDQRPHRWRAR